MDRVLFAPRALPPLRPDVAEDPGPFSAWVTQREIERRDTFVPRVDAGPLHLVMIMVGEPPPETMQTLQALQGQTRSDWTLTVVLHRSWQTEFTALLAVSGIHRSSQRVRVEATEDVTGPNHLLRTGLGLNEGADVGLIFPGDVWAPDAVAQLSSALQPGRVVYADEDVLTAGGDHVAPRLKPAYSPEFLLSSPYVGRPLALASDVLARLDLSSGTEPVALEHDLALRACDAAAAVVHVTEVLCHRMVSDGDEATTAEASHIQAALARGGQEAEVRPGPQPATFQIRRAVGTDHKASIVIPFHDQPRFLRSCIESIDSTRAGCPAEFLLVDNGSSQPETATLLDRLAERSDLRILRDDRPFNWAVLNNVAAREASGDVLVFLNNDVEARTDGWLTALCAQALRSDVGAVGARLLYPDLRLQHCGVVLGLGGAAGHLFVGLPESCPGYLNMAVSARECAGVTGACLATRRGVFEELGGFDERLGIDLNDIDYCLRAQRSGLRTLYEPQAELIHHESPSRGTAGDVRDIVHFIDRWKSSILADDPYLHPILTRVDSSCALRGPNEKEWWQQWNASLSPP